MKARFLIPFIALLLPSSVFSELRPAQALLQSFGGLCPGVMPIQVGQGSLVNVQNLSNVINRLKNEGQCFGANEVGNVLGDYNTLYENYTVYQDQHQSKLEAEKRVLLLTTLLEDPDLTASQISFIEQSIVQAQAELVSLKAGENRFNELSSRYGQGARQLVSSVDNFLTVWGNNNQCINPKSSLYGSLISNTLLATSAFAAPGTGLALAAGGMVVQSLSRFVHDYPYDRRLGNLDDAQFPLALRCVSEVITDQYCGNEKVHRVIEAYQDDFATGDDGRFNGIDLLKNHLSHLSKWLEEVYAGSAITSEGDLINREKPILQAEFLEKVKRFTNAFSTIRRGIFRRLNDENERRDAIAKGITGLVQIMKEPSLTPGTSTNSWSSGQSDKPENPIFVTRSEALLKFKLYDPTIDKIPNCIYGEEVRTCHSFLDFVQRPESGTPIQLTLEDWDNAISNALQVINETLDQVNLERARTVSVDAYTTLVRANADHRGESNALEGLEKVSENARRIMEYLSELGCELNAKSCLSDGTIKSTHPYFPQISNTHKTFNLTNKVIDLIKEGFVPRSMPDDILPSECSEDSFTDNMDFEDILDEKSFRITSCITKLLKLAERGNDVYFTKIREMVSYEIEARLAHRDFDGGIRDILLETRRDLIDSLLDTLGSDRVGLGQLLTALESSQTLSMRTLDEFLDMFEDELVESLSSPFIGKRERFDLCFRTLPYLTKSRKDFIEKIYSSCKGATFQEFRDGPEISWNDFVYRKKKRTFFGGTKYTYHLRKEHDRNKRFCSYYKYHNRNVLIQRDIVKIPGNEKKELTDSAKEFLGL